MESKDKPASGRILIVEDDPDVLEILRLMLEGEGHTVVTAEHGREALKATARGKPFDLIVMDISMPEMSGIEVGQALRADEKTADMLIAIHTGLDEHWVHERFADYDVFLTKAADTEVLVAEIGKLLGGPKSTRAQRRAPPPEPVFTADEAMQAQRALRNAISIAPETLPLKAFVAVLGIEIEQLRHLGKSDDDIAALITAAIGKDFSAELVGLHRAPSERDAGTDDSAQPPA